MEAVEKDTAGGKAYRLGIGFASIAAAASSLLALGFELMFGRKMNESRYSSPQIQMLMHAMNSMEESEGFAMLRPFLVFLLSLPAQAALAIDAFFYFTTKDYVLARGQTEGTTASVLYGPSTAYAAIAGILMLIAGLIGTFEDRLVKSAETSVSQQQQLGKQLKQQMQEAEDASTEQVQTIIMQASQAV